jgi:phosphoglycerate dehydrogenase-like enzyme
VTIRDQKPILLVSKQAIQNASILENLSKSFSVSEINGETWVNQELISNAEYLWIHFDFVLTDSILSMLPKCKLVLTTTTGLTHISEGAKISLGDRLVSLTRFRDELMKVTSTAELALNFLFHSQLELEGIFTEVRSGIWSRENHLRQKQISSLKVGIVGLGRLGGLFAKTISALGTQIYFCEVKTNKIVEGESKGYVHIKSVEELCAISDVVSIHANVNDEIAPIISEDILKSIHSSFVLINTSRSSLVDENAIIAALESGTISKYYADVLGIEDEEKSLQESVIWKESQTNNRIFITPHIGGATIEAMDYCEHLLFNELIRNLDVQ